MKCHNTDCPLHDPKNPPIAEYIANHDKCEILFLSEGINEVEQIKNRIMVGPAGGVFFQGLLHAGLASVGEPYRSYIYTSGINLDPAPNVGIESIVHCRARNGHFPTEGEIACCKDHFEQKLDLLPNLRVIVPMGDGPVHTLLGAKSITKCRGLPSRYRDYVVLPTLSPDMLLPYKRPAWFDLFVRDLIKAKNYIQSDWNEPPLIVDDITIEAVEELKATGFSFDIETTSLSAYHGEVIGIAFSNKVGHAWHAWKDYPGQWRLAVELLESDAYKCAQGNSFDVPFLRAKGVEIFNVDFDTQYAQKLLEPDYPATLGAISSYYFHYPFYKGQRDELLAGRLSRQQIKEYCGRDAEVTEQGRIVLAAKLKENPKLEKVFYEIVMPSSKVANNMQHKGVLMDLSKREQALEEINTYTAQWQDMFAKYGYNIDSPTQLLELFNKMGLKMKKTDKKALKKAWQRSQNPLVKTVIEYRPWAKVRSMLFGKTGKKGLFGRLDEKGYVHSRWKPNGTANSRWASSNPNLQNIPKKLRYLFIPEPGFGFLQADYKRLELHVAGVLVWLKYGDDTFLRDVERYPIHDIIAEEIYGPHYDDKQRLLAKTVVFGTIYGRGARSIAMDFGVTIAEAERMQNKIAFKYPYLVRFGKENLEFLKANGYLESAFGRHRYFEGGNLVSDAANYPVQTTAGDLNNTSSILLDPLVDLRLAVHDSLVIQYPLGEEDKYGNIVREVMSRPIEQLGGYQFAVSIEYGSTWGDLEDLNEGITESENEEDEDETGEDE